MQHFDTIEITERMHNALQLLLDQLFEALPEDMPYKDRMVATLDLATKLIERYRSYIPTIDMGQV